MRDLGREVGEGRWDEGAEGRTGPDPSPLTPSKLGIACGDPCSDGNPDEPLA